MLLVNGFVSFWTITCISALGSRAIGGERVTTVRRVAFAWFCPSSVVQFFGIIKDMPSVEFVYMLLAAATGLAVCCTINGEVLLAVFLIWAEGFEEGSNAKFMRPIVDSLVVGRIKQPKLHICIMRSRSGQDRRIHLNIETQLPVSYGGWW
jgi:hypothetical protein